MALAARKLDATPTDADQWVTVEEAAALTGLSVRRWRQIAVEKAASIRPHTASFPSAGLSRLAASRSGSGKPVWWVHRSLHPKLETVQSDVVREERGVAALTDAGYPNHQIARALAKAKWMHAWRAHCSGSASSLGVSRTDREWAEYTVAEAKAVEGDDFKIGTRTLQMWFSDYYSINESTGHIRGITGLIDKYVSPRQRESVHTQPSRRDPRAVDYFYSLYHSQACRSITFCHRATSRQAEREGWPWPLSYRATVRWLEENDDLSMTMLLREGRHEWAKRFRPHIEIDDSHLEPGEWYVSDHTRCDFWVTHKGKQIRPWLTAVQDLRTRCIVGWSFGPAAHQDSILAALRMAFLDWSIPKELTIDNGRDYRAKRLHGTDKGTIQRLQRELGEDWDNTARRTEALVECEGAWIGVLGELGIKTHFAIPYSPGSKGSMERWFRTFEDQCGKGFATYCGNSPEHRPDFLESMRRDVDDSEVPTLDAARDTVAAYIDQYHRTVHTGKHMNRQTPLSVWSQAVSLRKANADALLLLMEGRGLYTVGANGVTLVVGGKSISYGRSSVPLTRLRGREVFISMGDDPSCCYAFTADREQRRYLGRLACNERVARGVNTEAIREASNEVRREQANIAKVERATIRRHRSVVERANEETLAHQAELRATGTDDVSVANIVAVHTGFEGVSKSIQTPIESPPDDIDFRRALRIGMTKQADDSPEEPTNCWSMLKAANARSAES